MLYQTMRPAEPLPATEESMAGPALASTKRTDEQQAPKEASFRTRNNKRKRNRKQPKTESFDSCGSPPPCKTLAFDTAPEYPSQKLDA